MTRARLFIWTAAVVFAGAYLPLFASVLGYQLAGSLWQALRLTAPFLSQAGDVLAGAAGGLVAGLVERAILGPTAVLPAVAAGTAIGIAHALYPPLALVAAPLAAGLAAFLQRREARWVRTQAIAVAWIALALLLPFPPWAQGAFLLAAALVSTWGVYSVNPGLRRGA